MAYRLRRDESVEDGVRRIAIEQIDKALAEIDDDTLDPHDTVHQVRKRCKKLRALARLVRPAFSDYARVNATFRDAARELSFIRDAQAIVGTFDDLVEHYADAIEDNAFSAIRDELTARRNGAQADAAIIDRRLARFRDTMTGARAEAAEWRLDVDDGTAVASGAKKTYKRARKAMNAAGDAPTTAAFHEWRKRVKYHWHHAQLLIGCWPRILEPWAKEAHRLANFLGEEHDLAVLHAALLDEPDAFGACETVQAFTGLIERRRAELQAKAFRLGTFLLFEAPDHFERRIETWFDTWRDEVDTLAASAPRDVEQ
jgi:CHAD domain-containing protein